MEGVLQWRGRRKAFGPTSEHSLLIFFSSSLEAFYTVEVIQAFGGELNQDRLFVLRKADMQLKCFERFTLRQNQFQTD